MEKRKHAGGRPPSVKTLALRIAQDGSQGAWTRWQALLTLEPLIPAEDLGVLVRQILAATKRGRVVRLCLQKLAALEEAGRQKGEGATIADKTSPEEVDLLGLPPD